MSINEFRVSNLEQYISGGSFIKTKHLEEDIFIYGYSNMSNRRINWNETNVNLRGLILSSDGNILSRPMKKFFTFRRYVSEDTILLSENQIMKVPSSRYKIYEKLDGTMAILYWIRDKPFLATQRSFDGIKAKHINELFYSKYSHLFSKLNRSWTYVFEVISPQTRVIIDYFNKSEIRLIAINDISTGENINLEDIGFPLPKDFTNELSFLKSFSDIQNLNIFGFEGLVIHYESGERIKIKFPWYQELHSHIDQLIKINKLEYSLIKKLKTGLNLPLNRLSDDSVFSNLLKQKQTYSEFDNCLPEYIRYLGVEKNIKNKFDELKERVGSNERICINEFLDYDSIMVGFIDRISRLNIL